MKRNNYYVCHSCLGGHSTDNMVAFCATCNRSLLKKIEELECAFKDLESVYRKECAAHTKCIQRGILLGAELKKLRNGGE